MQTNYNWPLAIVYNKPVARSVEIKWLCGETRLRTSGDDLFLELIHVHVMGCWRSAAVQQIPPSRQWVLPSISVLFWCFFRAQTAARAKKSKQGCFSFFLIVLFVFTGNSSARHNKSIMFSNLFFLSFFLLPFVSWCSHRKLRNPFSEKVTGSGKFYAHVSVNTLL